MSVQGLLRLTVLMLAIILPWSAMHSFPVSHFKKESNLASGRWVKIEVGENGVYELTREELALMGFDNPAEVKVFGAGGHALPESITLVGKDDVEQVPTMLTSDDKVCFYANGICDIDVVNYYSSPYFSITKNPYSSHMSLHDFLLYFSHSQGQSTGLRAHVLLTFSYIFYLLLLVILLLVLQLV